MSSFYGRSGPSELLPRSIFLKPLVTGRRVLELGSVAVTDGATAVALLRLGARTVTAFDEDAGAIERARGEHRGNGVSFRTGRTDELPERSFDLVLVDDASRVVEPGAAATLGRLLAPQGHLVVPVRNPAGPSLAGLAGADEPAGPGWAEATAALRPLFESIEVATQQLLVGYVIAPVTGREAQLDIDATAGSAPAAYWLLLCGHRPTGLVDQALVALPPEPLFAARAGAEAAPVAAPEVEAAAVDAPRVEAQVAPELVARVAALEAERDEAAARAERAGAEAARLAARGRELEAAVAAERGRVDELRRAADSAREGLRERETWVDGLRVEVEGREEAETRTQAELRVAQARLTRVEPELHAAQEMLKRVREQLSSKIRELAAAQQAIAERTQDLRIAEEELERARSYAGEERQGRLAAEAAGAAAKERLAALEAELATAREAVARGGDDERLAALEAELSAARDEAALRGAEADALRARATEAERERDEAAEALRAGVAERDRAVLRCSELEGALAEASTAKPANLVVENEAVAAPPAEGPLAGADGPVGNAAAPTGALLDALEAERDRLASAVAERDRKLEEARRELHGQSDRIARLIAEVAELRARTPRPY